jgi:hypothetical protein
MAAQSGVGAYTALQQQAVPRISTTCVDANGAGSITVLTGRSCGADEMAVRAPGEVSWRGVSAQKAASSKG